MYEYGAPVIGKAEPNSSIMGRHKNKASAAVKSDIGELKNKPVNVDTRGYSKRAYYTLATAATAGKA